MVSRISSYLGNITGYYFVRLKVIIRGLAAVVILTAPVLADDGPPSMIAIAEALRGDHPQDAEALATQMLAAPDLAPLDSAYLHMNRGLAREKLDRRDDALADFTIAIDAKILPPAEQSRALFDRGVTLDEMGRTQAAIADYSEAIAIVPRYATALNNRGNAYRRTRQFELARADYAAALDAGDDEPEFPLYGLGRIAEAQGDPVLAQSFYNKALAANAGYTPASDRIAKLAATSTQASYSLHAPAGDVSVQVNMPIAAPTVPVTQTDPAQQVDLHPPRSEPPVQTARRGRHNSRAVTAAFGLRPAILDGAKAAQHPARSAAVTAPKVAPEILPPSQHETAAPPAAGSRMIQLGAWRDQAAAANGWNHIVGRSGGLLSGVNPHVVAADIPGKGRFWRLRAEPSSGVDAASLCEQLKAKGLACIVAKG
jgi:tetratricopeptide (TPR) repeat protein